MKLFTSVKSYVVFMGALLLLATTALPVGAWDFVVGELRVDSSDVYNARDYRVSIAATDRPSSGSDYTAGWIGIDLANNPGLYGDQFTQVGLLTDSTGLSWFVYAEPGVQCLQGQTAWGNLGCKGNNFVALNTFHRVELVTYLQGFWIARVYDTSGTPHDVAKIWSTSSRIYRATVTMEEATVAQPDPYLKASFLFWHPQFTPSGADFVDWRPSVSMSTLDEIRSVDGNNQNTFCPQHYGANPNQSGDQRYWYAGTGGQQCSWLLFPNATHYGPDVRSAQVVVQNQSSVTTRANQAFMRSDGSINCGHSATLPGRAQWIMNACGGSATVAVEGFGNVSPIVINDDGVTADSYEGIPSISSSFGLGVGTTEMSIQGR